jgi:endonuclease/exonuclease/phosphatase family metal-dependent hydrolase
MEITETSARKQRRPRRRRPHGCGCGRLVCLFGTLLAALYLAVVVYIEKRIPESNHLAFVLTYIPQLPLLVPLIPTIFLCIIAWQWRLLGVNLGLLALGIALLMPPVLGRPQITDSPARRIRIVSWNAHEEHLNVPRMAKVLAELEPDIVCLQESRSARFAEALPGAQVAHTREVTTLTRGNIVDQEPLRLGPDPNHRWGMDTEIVLPQGRVRVLNVHYVIDVTGRLRQIKNPDEPERKFHTKRARALEQRAVLKWLTETEGARAVVGDFNTPPNADYYAQLEAKAVDAFGSVGRGWGFTFRRDRPLIRIDYVWCAGRLQPLKTFTVDGTVSDHRLLVTDLLLPAEAGKPAPRRRLKAKPEREGETGPVDTG